MKDITISLRTRLNRLRKLASAPGHGRGPGDGADDGAVPVLGPGGGCPGCARPVAACRLSFNENTLAFDALGYDAKTASSYLANTAADRCRFCGAELPRRPPFPEAERVARWEVLDSLGRSAEIAMLDALVRYPGKLADLAGGVAGRVDKLREWAAGQTSGDLQV